MPQVHLGIAGPTAYYVMWMTGYNTVSLALPHTTPSVPLAAAAGCQQACARAAMRVSLPDRLCRAFRNGCQ